MDMNFGRTLSNPSQTACFLLKHLPSKALSWAQDRRQHLPLDLGAAEPGFLALPILGWSSAKRGPPAASSLLSLGNEASQRSWSSVGSNSLDFQP